MVATYVPGPHGPMVFSSTAGGASESTVLFDVSGYSDISGASVTSLTTSIWTSAQPNLGTGGNGTSNMCLVSWLLFLNGAAGTSVPTSVTWDPAGTAQAMTAIPGGSSTVRAGDIYGYYRLNPTQGQKQISATWTGANQLVFAVASFVNVNQTGGVTTFPSVVVNNGTSGVPTVSISTTPTTRKITGGFTSTANFSTNSGTAFAGSPVNTGTTWASGAMWDAGTATSLAYSPASSNWAGVGAVIKGA